MARLSGSAQKSVSALTGARWRPHRALLLLLGLSACVTTVRRLDETQVVDLSGYWNDSDSRLVSEEMVRDALTRPWLDRFVAEGNRRPVLLFDGIENRTAEHIAQETFSNSIQRELLNSGRVAFVAAGIDRGRVRAEREDQRENAAAASRSAPGAERGADFMLGGSIAYIEDASGSQQLRVYQVDLRLVALRDNSVVWSGQKIIRKIVARPRVRP